MADFYLKLDGIDGESKDSKHAGQIELQSWSWGQTNAGSQAGGTGGAGTGKVSMQDLHFVTNMSKASPKLFLACATGEHIKKAVLTCHRAGKDQQEYLKVTLTEAFVTSYQTGGHGDGFPVDQVSLSFSKFEFDYSPQKDDGTKDAVVHGGWDVRTHKKV
jgi:type VI secretion system secreted protein Hcp